MVTIPLSNPIDMIAIKVIANATEGATPAFVILVSKNAAIPKIEPTERSNSPEIIKRIPIAMIPNSEDKVNMEVIEESVKNLLENDQKTRS